MRIQPFEQRPVTVTASPYFSVPTSVLPDDHESRTLSVCAVTYMVLLRSETVTPVSPVSWPSSETPAVRTA